MNREEYLEYLLESLPHWPDDNHSAPHGWEFNGSNFGRLGQDIITIDDWNRAKIESNTKIRILSEEHSEYAQLLALDVGFKWSDGDNCCKYTEEPFLLFKGSKIDCMPKSKERSFEKYSGKEIFIEMPKSKEEASATGLVERMVTLNIPEEEEPNINSKVLAEKMSPLQTQVDGSHYKDLAIQPVEYIHANGIGFLEGSVIKYVSRWKNKNGIKDLEKAKHFIELLIELEGRK